MKTYYQVAIKEQNSWNADGSMILKNDCGHKHYTLSGVHCCCAKKSQYYADGSHNEWAHFGMFIAVDSCGVRGLNDLERQEMNDIEYTLMQHA